MPLLNLLVLAVSLMNFPDVLMYINGSEFIIFHFFSRDLGKSSEI